MTPRLPSSAPPSAARRRSPAPVFLLAGLFALASAAGGGQDGEERVAQTLAGANQAYDGEDFAAAIAGYRSLVAAGHDHPKLHYNLGNAYLRHGELGRAIASYRRAAAGAPRDQDVRANLAFARKNARDALAPPEPPAGLRTVFAWHYALAPEELWLAAALLNVALWSLLALRLRRPAEGLSWSAVIAGVVLAACLGSLAARAMAPLRIAVVLPREVDVRAAMQSDGVVRFKLHAGSEVRVREERDGWLRIRLPDGEQGWIEADAVEVVEL